MKENTREQLKVLKAGILQIKMPVYLEQIFVRKNAISSSAFDLTTSYGKGIQGLVLLLSFSSTGFI